MTQRAKKAVATKAKKTPKRAAKGKGVVLATWRGTYQEMTEIVRAALGFLEREEKMKYSRTVTPPECAFVYRSVEKGVALSVSSEYACAPWLVVHVGGHAYPVGRLVRALAPELVPLEPRLPSRGSSAKDVRALLEYWARFLRDHGRPVLDGDMTFFASLRKRSSKKP